jgi:uncharacterized protein YozE (UPF0346 family)
MRTRHLMSAAIITAAATATVYAQPAPNTLDLIAQARSIATDYGDRVWPGFADAPDSLILIDGEREFLLCHEGPAEGFDAAILEPVTGCEMRSRDRVFPPALLASFPAVDATPTIVVGTPQATGRDDTDWMITLLHEHFHQMQDAQPDAWASLHALDLHGGDQTGMWMLNYAFPYSVDETTLAARQLADQALITLSALHTDSQYAAIQTYLETRRAFLNTVSDADARYYELQVWKEGVARWTELAVARVASPESPSLSQYHHGQHVRMAEGLTELDLADAQRVAFYALGSAEAEMLEALWPAWKTVYFDHAFEMGSIFALALRQASPASGSD